MGTNPRPDFDTSWYLARYADVKRHGMNAFLHFVKYGRLEGRLPNARGKKNSQGYDDLNDYLKRSLLITTLSAPFGDEGKRCLAAMEFLRKQLSRVEPGAARPLVSVVMPAYNRESTIGEAIESVLAQSYDNFELIVVDDGSSDRTLRRAQAFASDPKVVVLESKRRGGASVARNAGLARATGDLVAYLDSDNLMHRDFLAVMVGAAGRFPAAGAFYCAQLIFEAAASAPSTVRFGAFNRTALENHNYIDLNALVHRRGLLQSVGNFDTELRRFIDWDFVLRISEACTMVSIPVPLSYYRRGIAENAISNNEDMRKAIGQVRTKLASRLAILEQRPVSPLSRAVSVLIPNYGSPDLLEECLRSLAEAASGSEQMVEYIVVDNDSGEEACSRLRELSEIYSFRLILNSQNYGFTHAVNQAWRLAIPGNDILLVNNDAVFARHSLAKLQARALSSNDIGIVVPAQMMIPGEPSVRTHTPENDSRVTADVTLSVHHNNVASVPLFHDGAAVDLTFAPFFCAYIKRRIIDELGGLDAEFGRHFRSDRTFCALTREYLGKRVVYEPDARVVHKHQRSTQLLKKERPAEYQMMYRANKWPEDMLQELGFTRAPWDY